MDGVRQFLRDEKGVTAIEYSLIAGVISIGIVGAVAAIGLTMSGFFTKVANGFP